MIHCRLLCVCAIGLCLASASGVQAADSAVANESLSIDVGGSSSIEPAGPMRLGSITPTPAPAPVGDRKPTDATDVASQPVGRKSTASVEEDQPVGSAGAGESPGVWWRTFAALAVVVGLVFVLKKGMQRVSGARSGGAPGALEILSKTPVSTRQSLLLVRVGSRLLVVGAGGETMNTLTEITDGAQVSELLGAVERGRAGSLSNAFAGALRGRRAEYGPEPTIIPPTDAAAPTSASGAADQMKTLISRIRSFGSGKGGV